MFPFSLCNFSLEEVVKRQRLRMRIGCCALLVLAGAALFAAHRTVNAAADDPSWGFSPGNLDRTCKPCDNFYEFAMGSWMKANPIPAEYSSWGTFQQLRDNNLAAMHTVLDAAEKANAPAGSDEQKIGDFYASCMDLAAIEAAGLHPLAGELSAVDGVSDHISLENTIAKLQQEGVGVLFRFTSGQDIKDSTRVIAQASQGGLGMPDRDYYLREDEKSKQLRADYQKHVANMFVLAGDAPDQ